MSENNETFSIDLTEDDVDDPEEMQVHNINNENMEQGNDHPYCASTAPNGEISKHQDQTSKNPSELSAVEFLEILQKENPQIETVFLESDEDDNTEQSRKHIKVQDKVIFNSYLGTDRDKNKIISTDSTNLLKILGSETNKVTDVSKPTPHPNHPSVVSNNQSTFIVREIPPSRFSQTLMKNSSTIALPEIGHIPGRPVPKKILVIPRELEPFLAKSQGPISLNIPGIGQILIPKPTNVISQQKSETAANAILKNSPKVPVYDPLSDSKYCWRYQRGRKRDIDGFSISDRLGFYKAEQQRTRICASKYKEFIHKLQISINIKKRALLAIKSPKLNLGNIKLVEIDSIKKGKRRDLSQNKSKVFGKSAVAISRRIQKTRSVVPKRNSVSPILLSSSESESGNDNNLLVTKKVVFINENEKPRGRKRKRQRWNIKKLPKKNQDIEEPSPKRVVHEADKDDKRKHSSEVSSSKNKLRRGRGRPRKINVNTSVHSSKRKKEKIESNTSNLSDGSVSLDDENLEDTIDRIGKKRRTFKNMEPKTEEKQLHTRKVQIKPCHVKITPDTKVKKALERYDDYASSCVHDLVDTCHVIDSLKQFQKEIQSVKPILVITEENCAKMDFQEAYCKYNIVFPIKESSGFLNVKIKNMSFAESAKAGFIKFVKPQILCKYLAGFREV